MGGRFRLGHAVLLAVPALAVALAPSYGRRAREDERATLAALRPRDALELTLLSLDPRGGEEAAIRVSPVGETRDRLDRMLL